MTDTAKSTHTTTHTDTPEDLIDQQEAADMFGRKKDTIRTWRREKKIEGYRGEDGRIYVSIKDINRHLAETTTLTSRKEKNPSKYIGNTLGGGVDTPTLNTGGQHPQQHPQNDTHTTTLKLYDRFIANLEGQVTEAKREKEHAQIELRNAREEIKEKDLKIRALELELYGTPKALLEEETPSWKEEQEEEKKRRSISPLKVRDRVTDVYDHLNKWVRKGRE